MKRPFNNLIGLCGVLAVLSLCATNTVSVWLGGAQIVSLFQMPLGLPARFLAMVFIPNQPTAAYWIFHAFYIVCTLVFAVAFWLRTNTAIRRSAALNTSLLVLQMLIGLAASNSLLVLISLGLAYLLPCRAALIHDAIGHHLTALNLHLELGIRQTDGHVIESFQTARELAQRLLSEVRDVVSIERQDQEIDVRLALESLCSGIPSPRIVLSFDDALTIRTPARA